jgi:hypothetical protein
MPCEGVIELVSMEFIDRVLDLVLVGLVWIPVPLVLNGDCLEADNTRPELDETVPMFGRPERKGGP